MQDHWHYKLHIDQLHNDWQLRDYLAKYLLIPRHLIGDLRHDQRILVNQKYLPVNFSLHTNDLLELNFIASDFKLPYTQIKPVNKPIEVLFENNDVIVVNKQRGDKTHPNQPDEDQSTFNFTAGYLATKNELPYMIHRLDQETSGAIIFGKNPAVVPILNELIAKKTIKRTYLAWVHGTNLPTSGTIALPIGRDLGDQRKRKVNGDKSVSAITHYQVVKTNGEYTLVKIELETGRTHQIRVHFAEIGHPLVGDPLYADDEFHQMLLHSYQLALVLPFSMETVMLMAPIPDEFYDLK